MSNVMKLSDFKIGDVIDSYKGICTIVATSNHPSFDFIVKFDKPIGYVLSRNYRVPPEQFDKISNPNERVFLGINIGNIRSKKIMRSKLADKLYKNVKKHGETKDYFYVSKTI